MSDKKLKPRVGDRVLVKVPVRPVTLIGWVNNKRGEWLTVTMDGHPDPWEVHEDHLTVVDRDPLEWPEGWSWFGVGLAEVKGRAFSRREIEHFLATGPDMLARWDELMGDDA